MSLFDNLKYQNIDLGNRFELETLPKELISLYWDEAHHDHPEVNMLGHAKSCRLLANWCGSAQTPPNTFPREVFKRALNKYNQ